MVPELRQQFNAAFTEAKYQAFLRALDLGCGAPVEFRNSETPCFFPRPLLEQMARYGRELIRQLLDDSDYLADAEQAIPSRYLAANEDAGPLFVQVDFGLDQELQPKLVEIQGFPSLYAYQPFLAETYRQCYSLDSSLRAFLGDLDETSYRNLLHQAVVGRHDPENVVLLEIEPTKQKTLCDFLLTERMLGIRTVDLMEVEREGASLFYRRDGRRVPINRIYNRVIADELERKRIDPPFDWRADLNVEWAGHPNWYFKISKFSLPYLRHACVPRCWFLDRMDATPSDPENYVLKPLFSFAGQGVKVGPTPDEVEAARRQPQMLLQERVDFRPTIDTPEGLTKAEVRIMYIWREEPFAVTALVRMGRGKMMGVDQNRDMRWVGASAAFAAP